VLRVCRCGVVAVTSLRHVNGAVRWTVEGMGAGGDRRATHGVEACGAAERDAATCCMHESGSGRGGVVEVGAGRSRGDGGHACGEGAGGEASSLPPELVFKLKRLTVLSALRSGDVVRAHALTAAHLGPLAAEQPSLQSMLSVRSLTRLPHPTPPISLPCSSLRACLSA